VSFGVLVGEGKVVRLVIGFGQGDRGETAINESVVEFPVSLTGNHPSSHQDQSVFAGLGKHLEASADIADFEILMGVSGAGEAHRACGFMLGHEVGIDSSRRKWFARKEQDHGRGDG